MTNQQWTLTHTPLAFHNSFPPQARPRLSLFHGGWFITYWVLFVPCLLLGFVQFAMLTPPGDDGPLSVLVALMLAAVELLSAGGLIMLLMIARGTPKRLVAMAVGWGAVIATMTAALVVSPPLLSIADKLGWHTVALSIAAAVPEEVLKGLGIWGLMIIGRSWWNRPWHGIVAGMLVGLGFEAIENAMYALKLSSLNPESSVHGVIGIYLLRLAMGPLPHVLMSGLVGYAIGKVLCEGPAMGTRDRVLILVGCMGIAMTAHFAWNVQFPADAEMMELIVYRGIIWCLLVAIVATVIVASRRRLKPLRQAGLEPAVTIYRRL